MNLTSQLRHFLSFLAGLGTMLVGWHLIAPDQVEAVNKAGADLIAPLMVILGAVGVFLFRLAIAWLGKRFPAIAEKISSGTSGGMTPLVVGGLALATAGIMGCLPSCVPGQLEALKAVPVKACYLGPDGQVCYSSKGGLEVSVDRGGK